MNDYILYIPYKPNTSHIIALQIFRFLSNRKLQIHKCVTDEEKIILVVTLYFHPHEMVRWFKKELGVKMWYEPRKQKVKRPYSRTKKRQPVI